MRRTINVIQSVKMMSKALNIFLIIAIWGYVQSVSYFYDETSEFDTVAETDFDIDKEVVNIRVYYEVLCGGCIDFDTKSLKPVILGLGSQVNVQTYPYGNARSIVDDNGNEIIECQHGIKECYGNMLHACALDIISNHTAALLYNICMMENSRRSDDNAADQCGILQSIDAEPIKKCAKSGNGLMLLKHYGEETAKTKHQYVQWVLVNEKLYQSDLRFFSFVCKQFKNPPNQCLKAICLTENE